MIEYKKTRSKFWLKIFDDEATHTNISANKMVMELLQEISPHLISCSPKGWKESSNIPGNYITVISGYAAGTDLAAHKSALENGGNTVFVLAEGILRYSKVLDAVKNDPRSETQPLPVNDAQQLKFDI